MALVVLFCLALLYEIIQSIRDRNDSIESDSSSQDEKSFFLNLLNGIKSILLFPFYIVVAFIYYSHVEAFKGDPVDKWEEHSTVRFFRPVFRTIMVFSTLGSGAGIIGWFFGLLAEDIDIKYCIAVFVVSLILIPRRNSFGI